MKGYSIGGQIAAAPLSSRPIVIHPDARHADDGVTLDLAPMFKPGPGQTPGNWKFMMTRQEALELGRMLIAASEGAGTDD